MNDRIKAIVILSLLVGLCMFSSCVPEDPTKNAPTNYIIDGSQDLYPAWSPDGQSILYAHLYDTAKNYPQGLYLVSHDGSNRRLVLAGYHFSPSWSPDGRWIVFTSGGTIQKCKINGDSLITFGGLSELKYRSFYFPSWTKDGKRIFFDCPYPSDGGGIFKVDFDFVNARRLFAKDQFGRDPELSPTNDKLTYYDWVNSTDPSEIFIIDTLGNSATRLTKNSRDDRGPTWSPDGLRIAWSSNLRLCIMNTDGSNQREVDFGNSPSWSINDKIVFSHANSTYTKEVLYTISPDGTNKKQITF